MSKYNKKKDYYDRGYLTNWNETRYTQPDTEGKLPTLWAVLFIVLAAGGLWTLGVWVIMVIFGGMR